MKFVWKEFTEKEKRKIFVARKTSTFLRTISVLAGNDEQTSAVVDFHSGETLIQNFFHEKICRIEFRENFVERMFLSFVDRKPTAQTEPKLFRWKIRRFFLRTPNLSLWKIWTWRKRNARSNDFVFFRIDVKHSSLSYWTQTKRKKKSKKSIKNASSTFASSTLKRDRSNEQKRKEKRLNLIIFLFSRMNYVSHKRFDQRTASNHFDVCRTCRFKVLLLLFAENRISFSFLPFEIFVKSKRLQRSTIICKYCVHFLSVLIWSWLNFGTCSSIMHTNQRTFYFLFLLSVSPVVWFE